MSDINIQVEYIKQRRERLESVIDDYMGVYPAPPSKIYEDILTVLEDKIKYHSSELDKANELYNLILGNKDTSGGTDSPGLTQ